MVLFISSLLPASGIYVEKDLERFQEAEVADDLKQTVFYRHSWTEVHMNSQRLAAHTRPGQVQTRESQHKKDFCHKVPSLTKKLLATDTCWEGENQFSRMECH